MRVLVLNNDHITRQAARGLAENGHDVSLSGKADDYGLTLDRLQGLLDRTRPDFCLMRNRRVLDRAFNPHAPDIEAYLCSNGIPCVSWFTENPLAFGSLDSINYFFLRRDENFLTLSFSPETVEVLQGMGHKAAYLPLAATSEWFRPAQDEERGYVYDVTFIGRPKVAIPQSWPGGKLAPLIQRSLYARHQNVMTYFERRILPRVTAEFLQTLEEQPGLELESFDRMASRFGQDVNLFLVHQLQVHLMFEAARLNMLKTVGWLVDAQVPIKLFGGHEWKEIFPQVGDAPVVPFEGQGEVYTRSKINLVLSKIELRDVVHERVFNIAACRGFAMAEHREAILTLFPGGEIPTFGDREELLEKVRYYLDSEEERRDLAGAAHERVMREHTFPVRMEQMIRIVRAFLAGLQSHRCEGRGVCEAASP